MHIRAIQGHSGGALVDRELLNNDEIPYGWKEHLCHVGGSLAMHSIMQARLIAVGKDGRLSLYSSGPFGR